MKKVIFYSLSSYINKKDIVELNIPTGVPLVYELDEKLRPVKSYYLGNEWEIN